MSQLVQINPTTTTGRKYWRSLDQLTGTPEFKQWVEREFPEGIEVTGASRRSLLKLMAASFGLAGLAACRRPVEHILPHAKGIEGFVHGKPLHYATVATVGGAATGLMIETHEGRPTKVEGNEKHPASLGATSAHMQALVLALYDPDRAKGVKRAGARSSWDEFTAWAKDEFSAEKQGDGAGLRILAERSSSPSLKSVRGEIAKKFPKAQWVEFDSVNFDNARLGVQIAFGQPLEAHYDYSKADVVLALDADFLGLDSPTILPVKQFSAKRRVTDSKSEINRLYAAESNYSMTGAMADHRLRVRASDVAALALAVARELNIAGGELKILGQSGSGSQAKFVAAVAKDLANHRGKSIVVAGPRQPKEVHALAALINQVLGNVGTTVNYTAPVVEVNDSVAAVKQLTSELNAGQVKTLVVLGGNPAYTLPADLKFKDAMKKAGSTVVLAAEENETWAAAQWQLPEAHVFEAWGDARALDGTISIQQPMVAPLYYGKPALEVAAMVAGLENANAYDVVKSFWAAKWGAAADKTWKLSLYNGFVEGTKLEQANATADIAKVYAAIAPALQAAPAGIEVTFHPGHSTWDGRFANSAWMQEAPDPMTKVVWDNAALMSQATADKLSVKNGSVVNVSAYGYGSDVAVMVMPGHADDSISLTLGYGRAACGRVGRGVGHRVEGIRTTGGFHIAQASVKPNGNTYKLVTTQEHHTLEEPITHKLRPIVLEATMEEYAHHPDHFEHAVHVPEVVNMFEQFEWKGQQWGMAIDLNSCTGCNACLVACQAENNIPVVGKEQVGKGREMHWIRLDRYFTGELDDPQVVNQPMACVQCENAPCESVCPVAATTHSPEGLNDMAYNRCVGTRYCANNCPYKVRRFNFLNWNKDLEEAQKMVFNPDVTVRMRGVMEKCNYCVQRIQEKRIETKANNRAEMKDGDVKSACQQACPAEAIVFGNINDPQSRVAQMKKQQRDYILLEELNIKPRTSYLGKLRNPNPELTHG
ncbi:MAG TPA: TAT-variant-translocated molybdopterin oxidoreductase [Bryobacteraceae bacterium]|nr:TAT-variant-translocated molybdopterin oxidoreductase [Bryobacteraceae bacterium]